MQVYFRWGGKEVHFNANPEKKLHPFLLTETFGLKFSMILDSTKNVNILTVER